MTSVSVIIPSFNAKPWIGEAITSALGQNLKDMEIIVIDDGSTDGTSDMVEKNFPFVRLIRAEHDGPSRARNIGTRESKGEFIQYLDADDILVAGKIKRQIEALRNSGADVAYGDWRKLVKTDIGKYAAGDIVNVKRNMSDPEIDLFTDSWCPVDSYLYRRSIVTRTGGWNEGLPVIQDARFALDCALQGARFIYCEGIMVQVRWRHSPQSVSQKSHTDFNRDVFKNAREIEQWWNTHGGIGPERKKALLRVYGAIARGSFEEDKPVFDAVFKDLKRLDPCYIPQGPRRLRIASRLLGYKNAERLALFYRHIFR